MKIKNRGIDFRDTGWHLHTIPELHQVFVKAVGANSFSLSAVREINYTLDPEGNVKTWTAYVGGNAHQNIEAINSASQWKWSEWHSLKDDDALRDRLDAGEMAAKQIEAAMKASKASPVDAAEATPEKRTSTERKGATPQA